MKPFCLVKGQRLSGQRRSTHDRLTYKSRDFVFLVNDNPCEMARIKIIVPKKHVALSVNRNQIKRWVRECFRINQQTFRGFDLVVILKRPNPEQSYQQCMKDFHSLEAACQKAGII